jgi:sialate O-acetylesterase
MLRAFFSAVLVFTAAMAAQLRITGGAVDDQVLQRGANDRADVPISGTSDDAAGAAVEVRVTRKHFTLEGFDWKPLASVQQGKWTGLLRGLPVGGPYRIEVRLVVG